MQHECVIDIDTRPGDPNGSFIAVSSDYAQAIDSEDFHAVWDEVSGELLQTGGAQEALGWLLRRLRDQEWELTGTRINKWYEYVLVRQTFTHVPDIANVSTRKHERQQDSTDSKDIKEKSSSSGAAVALVVALGIAGFQLVNALRSQKAKSSSGTAVPNRHANSDLSVTYTDNKGNIRHRPSGAAWVLVCFVLGIIILGIGNAFTGKDRTTQGNKSPAPTAIVDVNATRIHSAAGAVNTVTSGFSERMGELANATNTPVSSAAPTAATPQIPLPPASGREIYFEETQHKVDSFIDPFQALGGVYSLGFPISEPTVVQSFIDHNWYAVQYFERAALEYHPELDPTNRYLIMPLGVWYLKERYPEGLFPSPVAAPGTLEDGPSWHFPESGYTVSGVFLKRWQEDGGVRRFGYPISNNFVQESEADRVAYIVQYFERAVMEYHSALPPPYDVQLSALGSFYLSKKYGGDVP
jgi:hypothetical protein